MAEATDPRRPLSQPGTFSRILTALAQALKWLLLSLLFIERVALVPSTCEEGVRATLHHAYRPTAEFILAAMQMTQVFAVRQANLTLAMPVFGLFAGVDLVDGLVRRDLRRWGGGRESSFGDYRLGVLSGIALQSAPVLGNPSFCYRVWPCRYRDGEYV